MKAEAIGVVDIGASGGRFSTLVRDARAFRLETIREFSHPLHELHLRDRDGLTQRRLVWNPMAVYEAILDGIRAMAVSGDRELISLGLDSWGSDGVWVGVDGDILTPAYASRCTRFDAARSELEKEFPGRERFRLTGTYPDAHVILNGLYWAARRHPRLIDNAEAFLPLVSLYNFWFCGEKAVEYTWGTTGQLASTLTRNYCNDIFERLRLPLDKMPPLETGGGALGFAHKKLAENLGVEPFRVMLQPAHDTACAFAAAATAPDRPALVISAGSWWCLGMALERPLVTDTVYDAKLTNVGGAEGVILNQVVPGGVLSHFLRRSWEREDGRPMSWDAYNRLAQEGYSPDLKLDIDDPRLAVPSGIPEAVAAAAGREGAPENDRGRLAAAVYMGLAEKTMRMAKTFGKLMGRRVEEILVIGGGARNDLLNQWLANATGLPVRTGPDNATTLGNALVQARDLGWFSSLEEGRKALGHLWREKVFLPRVNSI